ncbi:hypothetical protein WN48_01468 [Eufriesea mexicana]|nr:hypothetical protein WN48_01468 [Eufriesea mexicana]
MVGKGRDAFRPGPVSGLIGKATLTGSALDRDTIGRTEICEEVLEVGIHLMAREDASRSRLRALKRGRDEGEARGVDVNLRRSHLEARMLHAYFDTKEPLSSLGFWDIYSRYLMLGGLEGVVSWSLEVWSSGGDSCWLSSQGCVLEFRTVVIWRAWKSECKNWNRPCKRSVWRLNEIERPSRSCNDKSTRRRWYPENVSWPPPMGSSSTERVNTSSPASVPKVPSSALDFLFGPSRSSRIGPVYDQKVLTFGVKFFAIFGPNV